MDKRVLVSWEMLGMKLSICSVMLGDFSWYCGYVSMPYRISENILNEIDVFGGITYTEQEGEMWVYGFDTMHSHNIWTPEQLRTETESMALQLLSVIK